MTEHPETPADQPKDRRSDPRTNAQLLQAALGEPDDDGAWEAISTLHLRGSQETFEAARKLCMSEDSHERRVGADILGQLGTPAETFREEAVTLLLHTLEREQDPAVLHSIGVALGHRRDLRAIPALLPLKAHHDGDVRDGVVFGLLGHEDESAIQALIELSTDAEPRIRDWATFGLGSIIDRDTAAIREALAVRLTDEDYVTRGEAMVGLARRHDPQVIEPLLADLVAAGTPGTLELEAAAEMRDPRLYLALLRLRENWEGDKNWVYDMLEKALEHYR